MYGYNYAKGEYVKIESVPEDWREFIPQLPVALNMYDLLLKMGKSSEDAAIEVLTACIGKKVVTGN